MRTSRAACLAIFASAALCLAAVAGSAAGAPTGYWKLSLTADYESTGTATDSRCFPDPSQVSPTALTADASERIAVRTSRPTLVDAHLAPNGIFVFGEYTTARAFRATVSAHRGTELGRDGRPFGCFPRYSQRASCGARSLRTGLYISPVGRPGHWRGFDLELQQTPTDSFGSCPVTDAQNDLPKPFEFEVVASPRKLVGHAPKLMFHGKRTYKGTAREGTVKSSGSGTVRWTVTLVRARP